MTEPERRPPGDMTIAELLERVTSQTSRLVRQEVTLVREELLTKAYRAGMGAMLFGGAGALAVYGSRRGRRRGDRRRGDRTADVGGGAHRRRCDAVGERRTGPDGRRKLRRAFPLVSKDTSERVKADAKAITEGAGK